MSGASTENSFLSFVGRFFLFESADGAGQTEEATVGEVDVEEFFCFYLGLNFGHWVGLLLLVAHMVWFYEKFLTICLRVIIPGIKVRVDIHVIIVGVVGCGQMHEFAHRRDVLLPAQHLKELVLRLVTDRVHLSI